MTALLAALVACPQCATRPNGSGLLVLIAAITALPYLISVFVIRAVRRADD